MSSGFLGAGFLVAGAAFLTTLAGAFFGAALAAVGAAFLITALVIVFLALVADIMLVLTHFKG